VIEESGLSAGAIYGYFAGKQELFAAVAGRVSKHGSRARGAARARRALSPGQVMATLIDGMRREPFGHVIVQLWGRGGDRTPKSASSCRRCSCALRETVRQRLVEWATAEPDGSTGIPTNGPPGSRRSSWGSRPGS
jgi:AcrR family transcriptional regulator